MEEALNIMRDEIQELREEIAFLRSLSLSTDPVASAALEHASCAGCHPGVHGHYGY